MPLTNLSMSLTLIYLEDCLCSKCFSLYTSQSCQYILSYNKPSPRFFYEISGLVFLIMFASHKETVYDDML